MLLGERVTSLVEARGAKRYTREFKARRQEKKLPVAMHGNWQQAV
jgi:hypothetical protein